LSDSPKAFVTKPILAKAKQLLTSKKYDDLLKLCSETFSDEENGGPPSFFDYRETQ